MRGGGIAEVLNFKQKNKDLNEFIKVPTTEKLAYCFGDPALTLMYTMTSTLLIYFYTNVVGMSFGAVGMIMLVSRVFDGFSDVFMGVIIDRTHSKYGKARIWILRMTVPYALAAIALFTMPPMEDKGKIIYAFVSYNIMNTVVYTAISQPFHALGSLMSRDRRERDVICSIRMVLSIAASMIITAFTLPLINLVARLIDNNQLAWILVTAVYALLSVFILLNTYMTCTERVQADKRDKKSDIPFRTAFKATITNRYFLIALGLMIFYTAYQIIVGTDLTYYCQYVLNDVNLVMPLSASEKIATIVGIAMLPKILPRFGKRNLICAGCLLGIAGQLIFLLNITSVPLGVVTCIMRGFGIAPFYGVQYSLPSDAIEYGHWKNGVRVEGLMFSSMSMGQKAGSGLTSAIMGAILSMAAFDGAKATAAQQSAGAIEAIKGFYLYVPIAIWVIMFLITLCYKLDKIYDKIIRDLVAREGKAQAELTGGVVESESSNRINVAIGRLYGSSGRRIAEGIAGQLGCRVYDRQIICLLAEKLGMETANLDEVTKYLDFETEKRRRVTFSPYQFVTAGAAKDYSELELFDEQSQLITSIAQKAPGVFLGRCAGFVLAGVPHTYSFFIYADDEYRIKEGDEYYQGQTLEDLKNRDQQRDNYYYKFTGLRRSDPKNYDLVVNVSKTGVDGAVLMILDYIKEKEKEGGNDVE